jgi:hypothetical protein
MSVPHQFEIDQSLRSAVKTFFDKVSLCPPQPRRCLRCGQEMQYLNASFSLSGTDCIWQVNLPVCPCELEGSHRGPSVTQ